MSEKTPLPTYGQYLKLEQLLDSQKLVSGNRSNQNGSSAETNKPAHDEMLFIIVHQAYELLFKQVLHELSSVITMFDSNFVDEKSINTAVSRLARVVQIEKLMIEQIKVLETMTPLDFLEFRNDLTGASGFQSVQFRIIENTLGLRPEQRLKYGNREYHADYTHSERDHVLSTESKPTLFQVVERWLERTPFLDFGSFSFVGAYTTSFRRMLDAERQAIHHATQLTSGERELRLAMSESTESSVLRLLDGAQYQKLRDEGKVKLSFKAFLAALFINLYREQPILQMPYRLISTLVDIDEYLTLWRYRHSLMVQRMIGAKMGTGGSTGHDYLRATVEKHRIFLDLFNLSTLLIPRSELPELPEDLERNLSFHFTVAGEAQR